MAKIAILGYGVVGSGVAKVISENKGKISKEINEEISIKYILDLRKFPEDPYGDLVTDDFSKILNDDEISIVVETMGGVNPAYDFTKKLLESNKSVVTSNKAVVAAKGAELLKIAADHSVNYMFEASVGGGIPVIRPLCSCLLSNKITRISGILNGTTNYILSKMINDGKTFDDALFNAQQKGYAEKDPTDDVCGYDAARKIAILASLVSGKTVDFNKVETVGIKDVDDIDVKYAKELDCSIKLIASCEFTEDGMFLSVEPSLVPKDNPLNPVSGVFNGILINGNAVGDIMLYGKGAGKMPTASAVVADVIDAAKRKENNGCIWKDAEENVVLDNSKRAGDFLVRIKGEGKKGSLRAVDGEYGLIFNNIDKENLEKELLSYSVIKIVRIS